jgi:uncharacterized protein YjbI with pentapeptide repeats
MAPSTKKARVPRDPLAGDVEPAPFDGLPDDESETENVRLTRARLGAEAYVLVDWRYATFDTCSLAGSTWSRSHFTDATFDECDLANTVFDKSGLERVRFRRGRMTGFTVSGCALVDVQIDEAVADLSVWRFAKVEHAVFRDCRLAQSDWMSATLTHVRFDGCDFSDADFSQCQLDGVTFTRCTFEGVRGADGLRGAAVDRAAFYDLTEPMAATLGITLVD